MFLATIQIFLVTEIFLAVSKSKSVRLTLSIVHGECINLYRAYTIWKCFDCVLNGSNLLNMVLDFDRGKNNINFIRRLLQKFRESGISSVFRCKSLWQMKSLTFFRASLLRHHLSIRVATLFFIYLKNSIWVKNGIIAWKFLYNDFLRFSSGFISTKSVSIDLKMHLAMKHHPMRW